MNRSALLFAWILVAPVAAVAASAPGPNWLKMYHLAPYKEIWSTDVTVAAVEKTTADVVKLVEKNGGKLTAQLSAFAGGPQAQQLSFSISRKGALAAGKALKKLGTLTGPRVSIPADVVSVAEVRAKLLALTEEKQSHAQMAAETPVAAAVVDELIERLTLVESVQAKTDSEILWNINVQVRR